MNLNEITKLIREYMMFEYIQDPDFPDDPTKLIKVETDINKAINGNIYSSYIDNDSQFPCITNHILNGTQGISPDNGDVTVQCKVWTNNNKNPSGILYAVYALIKKAFFSEEGNPNLENDILYLTVYMRENTALPTMIQEVYEGNVLYSLPFYIDCKAIFL